MVESEHLDTVCPNEIFIKHGFSVTSRTNYNINNHRSVSLFSRSTMSLFSNTGR